MSYVKCSCKGCSDVAFTYPGIKPMCSDCLDDGCDVASNGECRRSDAPCFGDDYTEQHDDTEQHVSGASAEDLEMDLDAWLSEENDEPRQNEKLNLLVSDDFLRRSISEQNR